MIVELMLFILACLLLRVWLVKKFHKENKNDPPGPSMWLKMPFVGHTYLFGNNPIQDLMDMKEKYGPIFRFDMGSDPTVFLCDYELMLEASKTKSIYDKCYTVSNEAKGISKF